MKRLIWICTLALAITSPGFAQKTPVKKPSATSGSSFEMSIEHNGQRTDIRSTQFQSADGNAFAADQGRVTLFFGASNDKDDKNLTFNGWVPAGQTGTFTLGESSSVGFSAMTSLFSNVPLFMPERGGTVEITNNPMKGGFVTGTFSAHCKVVTEAGTVEDYTIIGSFKLSRR